MPLPALSRALELPAAFWEQLRLRFDALGITPETLTCFDLIGPEVGDPLRLPLQQWTARQEGSHCSLATAFLRLGEDVSAAELQDLLGPELEHALRNAGLVGEDAAGRLRFRLKLGTLGEQWILADAHLTEPDSVMGASAATARIFDAVWQNARVESLLDLGCGGGALALALSGMAGRVAGADISERAIQMAALNARLNGATVTEFRQGDLFAPFSGERFHRIVCQPPFIPSMNGASTFASGGPLGDALTLRILNGLPDALSPGGRAVLCVEWARSEENEWLPRFREALQGKPVHVVHFDCFRTAADDYCVMLAPYLHPIGDAGYGAFLKEMLHHYRSQRISTVDLVLHALEPAPDGVTREWVRRLSLEALPHVSATAIDASFAGLRLVEASDETLLEARLRAADGLAVGDDLAAEAAVVWVSVEPRSLARAGYADGDSVRLAMQFGSGSRTRDVLAPALNSRLLDTVRELIRHGYLIPDEETFHRE